MTGAESALLWELQRGLPLVAEPFAAVGARLGLTGADVLAQVQAWLDDGCVRRLGAIFDARRLGYRSALCAASLPAPELPRVAAAVCAHPGVTHGYERGWPTELAADSPGGPAGRAWPNFWFTLAAEAEAFPVALAAVEQAAAPAALLVLPARRRFKIDVTFDPRTRERDERVVAPSETGTAAEDETPPEVRLTQAERALVRALEGSLPLVARPFAAVAEALALSETDLLARLNAWSAAGVLRRLALIVRHRQLGFVANGMCVWDVPEAGIVAAGRRVAAEPAVTHCYQRPRTAAFPFALYAMIHTGSWARTQALFARIGANAGLTDGQLLLSLREFKKTSMSYFAT